MAQTSATDPRAARVLVPRQPRATESGSALPSPGPEARRHPSATRARPRSALALAVPAFAAGSLVLGLLLIS
jgi:hypothetical protein